MSEQVFTNLTNCGPVSVYVNDGVVTRIRPLVADDEAEFRPWVIEADGKQYSPPKKFNLAPMVHAERRRLYSDERIKYPMKRVDFDPDGERNPQNRGKSAYERISWDEALDIVSSEIARVKKTYGSSAISGMTSSHHNWGIVGYKMGPFMRFMNCLEATPVFDNPDSWEGWHWGATHTYGFYWRLGMPEPFDNLQDVMQNSELIVFWSNDPDTTRGTYSGQESAIWRTWLKEKGVQAVFIDPFHNYTNAIFDQAKWIAPRMGTDTALAMAIAYVWITEDTYDKEYVADRTIGFDEFKPYVLGETDGVPKTPEWAAEESGVEARVIRTLAREWAGKRTVLSGRRARRRGQRLPHRLRHRVGADDGAPPGHAGSGQAGRHHRRASAWALRRTSRPGSRPTPSRRAACPTRPRRPTTSRRTPRSSGCGGSPCRTPS